MKLRFPLSLLLLAHVSALAEPSPIKPEDLGYKLVWADEFDAPTLDAGKWNTSYAPKVHPLGCNGEQQSYAREQVSLRDGKLVLQVERKPREGMPFTSGMVASHDKFTQRYGWFEARLKLPRGKGLWPAFWLLPQSKQWPPEIDIMEHKGRIPDRVWLTVHERQPNTWQPKSDGKEWSGPDFTADFHTFAVDWRPDRLAWFVDGIERHQWRGNADFGAMYLILNLAIGGHWDGNADATTPLPSVMEIDYVRVYQRPL